MTIGGGIIQHTHLSASSGGLLPEEITPMRFIERKIAAGEVNLDFLNLTGYNHFRLIGRRVLPSAEPNALFLRTSRDNGALFDNGVADYRFIAVQIIGGGARSDLTSNGTNRIPLTGLGVESAPLDRACSFELDLFDFPSTTVYKYHRYRVNAWSDVGQSFQRIGTSFYQINTNAINAIRLLWSGGGTHTSGIYDLYGVLPV